jgi:hypothetical protein
MRQAINENRLGLALARTALRLVDAIPAVKQRMLAGMGEMTY